MFDSAKSDGKTGNITFSHQPVCPNLGNKAFKIAEGGFDRAIVPTPYGMDHFLGKISTFVRRGGYIHFYSFKAEAQISGLIEEYEKMGFKVEFYKRSGNIAPGISRWVFDLIKK
jgi:tRNA (guanine37-N1)-methyltransferase